MTLPLTVDAVTGSSAPASIISMSPVTHFNEASLRTPDADTLPATASARSSPLTLLARMLPVMVLTITLASSGTRNGEVNRSREIAWPWDDRAHFQPVRLLGHLNVDHLEQRARGARVGPLHSFDGFDGHVASRCRR